MELESGEKELSESISEYEDKKAEAEELIQDAREEIEELKMADDLCLQYYGWIPTSHLDSPPEPISHQDFVRLVTFANT